MSMGGLPPTPRLQIIWWPQVPWRWRPYYVHRSKWGPFRELHLGFVSFVWSLR